MSRLAAFANPGRFWRGNLHTHSNRSDGALDPAEVCRRYRAEGYDFIALTDHFVGLFDYPITDTTAFRTPGFTTIPGAELHSGAQENGQLWHLLAVGLPPGFARPNAPHFAVVEGMETAPDLAARAVAAGAFVAIAHPQWSGLTPADAQSITAAHAVEIYNHGCFTDSDRADGAMTADALFSGGRRLTLIATDDAHFHTADHFGGWVMVKAEENEPEALVQALKDGAFYATQGPELRDVRIEGKKLVVECSAARAVCFLGAPMTAAAVSGASLTQAEMPLNRFAGSPFVRVAVIDAAGRRAWSNPVWLD